MVEFTSEVTGLVTVKFFDNLGRVVRLYDGPIERGTKHQIYVDGSNLPSGVYICVLQAGGMVITQTLVLER